MKSEPKLGHTIDDDHAGRDAIHQAVAPVTASEILYPGQRVGFTKDGGTEYVGKDAVPLGIVDPFLRGPVYPQQRFWLFLFPRTITGLRHEWTHPAFDDVVSEEPVDVQKARKTIETIAAALDLTYNALMSYARDWVEYQDYTVQIGRENWRDDFPEHAAEFWKAYEVVMGVKVEEHVDQIFSCSC